MMAVMTGVAFVIASLAGLRYGLIAAPRRRRRLRVEHAVRTLALHLYHHETGTDVHEENTIQALHDHLR